MLPKPEHLGAEVWNGILSVLCLRSFEFRVHFNVSFNLEKYNFILRRKKTIAFIKIFMNKVRRASWTTNDSYETSLRWLKCKWLRNMQIKFPWKHSRAPRINGGKYLDDVDFRRCALFFFFFFILLILFSSTKHFLGWLHPLWSGCCQPKSLLILVHSGWPDLTISYVPSLT